MQNDFNLLGAGAAWKKGWKGIILFTLLAGFVAAITVFLVPQYYQGTTTLVSANPVLADKARFFNSNIQGLYSYFGSGDDLDRIQGIADMDSTYKKLVDEFSLTGYYRIKDNNLNTKRAKAVKRLRRDIGFQRTEQGQLKLSVWMKQPQLAADIANRMVSLVSETEEAIWQKNYHQSLQNLQHSIGDMEQTYQRLSDTAASLSGGKKELAVMRMQTLLEQIRQYRKSADEFSLAEQAHPAVLYVLQPATAAPKPDRPEKLPIIIAACFAGFLFSSLVILFRDGKPRA